MSKLSGNILVQGAGRGIGLAMVERLLESTRVDHLVAASRAPEDSDTLQRLAREHGERLQLITLDVTDDRQVEEAARTVRERFRKLHGLINVSGTLHDPQTGMAPEKRIEALETEHLERAFRVNTFGPMRMAKHFLPLLRHQEPAFFASLSARVGSIGDNHLGGWYSYRASKAAQNQFTRTLAVEASRRARHLRVLALHPGTTDTELSRPFQGKVPEGKLFSPEFVAQRLLEIIADTDTQDSGRFIAWDGKDVPW